MEAELRSCEHLSVMCEEVWSLAHCTMNLGNVCRDILVPWRSCSLSQGDRALMSGLHPFVCVASGDSTMARLTGSWSGYGCLFWEGV